MAKSTVSLPYKAISLGLAFLVLVQFGMMIYLANNFLAYTNLGQSDVLASTSEFQQTINPGTLSVDIVDGGLSSVASPAVALGAVTFSFSCQTSTGTFGTASEQIYVSNPDAADSGWNVTMAASNTTDNWTGASGDYDFNDGDTAGCADGAGDADSYAGQMTVDPSGGTLAVGDCDNTTSCTTGNISLGSSSAYEEGTTDSITLLSGAATSDDRGDWTLQGVDISQTIPGSQPAASDYALDMTLTVTAL